MTTHRLPTPGSDNGTWGNILNDFLSVEHNADGTLKRAADITDAKTKADSAVQTVNGQGADSAGNVSVATLPSTGGATPGNVITYDGSQVKWASLTGSASWDSIMDKPAVIAAGDTEAAARTAIGAGTSSFSGSYNDLADKPSIPSTAEDVGAVPLASGLVVVDATANNDVARPTGVGAVYWLAAAGNVPTNVVAGDFVYNEAT